MAVRRAVFLDKDGTLIDDIPFNVDPARIRLARGASSLARLTRAGFKLMVVSNQPGIARGHFDEAALARAYRHIDALLGARGVRLSGFYYCPHGETGACACRKPRPGLLRRAARVRGIDLARSWLVGDILDDVEAGRRAGCRTVLLDVGNETEWRTGPWRTPHVYARGLDGAVRAILAHAGQDARAVS